MNLIETTCTDCMKPITMGEVALGRRTKLSRLCQLCKGNRRNLDISRDDLSPPTLGNYRTLVELQWMVTPGDLEYIAIGDDEADFSRRSMFKMRDHLQLVAGCGHNLTPIGHYYFKDDELRRCIGPAAKENRAPGWVQRYHHALENLALLMLRLEKTIEPILGADMEPVDFSDVATALAVGYRQGWSVSEELLGMVKAAENNGMPMSEAEAGRRMNLR